MLSPGLKLVIRLVCGIDRGAIVAGANVMDSLKVVLQSTYFMYNGDIYEQQEGAAMSSPVSLEEHALKTCPPKSAPRIWKRSIRRQHLHRDSYIHR